MTFSDYSAPLGEPMTKRFIRRHRLEKRDPSAAVSEPVEPIVYYLDPGRRSPSGPRSSTALGGGIRPTRRRASEEASGWSSGLLGSAHTTCATT